ncbi:MAG TPA: hypothetical protein VFJ18_03065 [Pararhizobium sp.]|nr:hypothetical protein [Pararhizobium sp.]
MTNGTNLGHLEQEVEAARAKLAGDLASLRSPEVSNGFTDALKQEAMERKDALAEQGKTRVQSTTQSAIEDLKAKAASNPLAALAIGAGVGWRLWRHPPIATALVGAGLFGLMRTKAEPRRPDESYLTQATERLKEQASEAGAKAGERVSEAAERVKEEAAELAGSASEKTAELTGTAKERAAGVAGNGQVRAAELAGAAAERTAELTDGSPQESRHWTGASLAPETRTARRDGDGSPSNGVGLLGDESLRDQVLLGTAAAAVAAAVGLAYQKRSSEERHYSVPASPRRPASEPPRPS